MTRVKKFDLATAIAEIARRKQGAAKARRERSTTTSEAPRGVYLKACEAIGEAVASDGFRYLKSGPQLVKSTNQFQFFIRFQSSHHNVANQHVAMWIHAGVQSRDLMEWMQTSCWPFSPPVLIAGGQIGNLVKPPRWWEWDLADAEDRRSQIDDAVNSVRNIILPFLDRFLDLKSLVAELQNAEVFGIESDRAVLLCLWQSGQSAAAQCLKSWLDGHPRWIPDFSEGQRWIASGGRPNDGPGGAAFRLGVIAATCGLTFNS
jgi:hypothetical protein